MNQLRILILGAGATGGYYGIRLLQAKAAEVSFLVRTAEQAVTLNQKGLTLISPIHGNVTVKNFDAFARIEDDQSSKPHDVIILSCKAYDLDSACEKLAPFVKKHPGALILPILNGLAHVQYLCDRFGAERIVGGVSHLSTTLEGTGVIRQITEVHKITFGSRATKFPHTDDVLSQLKSAFEKTVVPVLLSPDIEQELWEKFVVLATLAASTCLARGTIGDIMSTDEGEKIIRSMLDECIAAAVHGGHPPRMDVVGPFMGRLTQKNSMLAASMMRDMEGKGRTEGRHVVYDMLCRARAANNPAVYLSVAWMVLQARDSRVARELSAL